MIRQIEFIMYHYKNNLTIGIANSCASRSWLWLRNIHPWDTLKIMTEYLMQP